MPKRDASLTVFSGRETIPLADRESFDNDNRNLKFARISPVLRIGDEVVEYVYFDNLKFLANKIDFGGGLSVNLIPGTDYELTVFDTPEMIPMPNGLNKMITSLDDHCYFQLFRRTVHGLSFVDQYIGPWRFAFNSLEAVLERKGMYPDIFRLGLVMNANQFPDEIYLLDEFFGDMSNGRAVMVLCCDDSIVLECERYKVSTQQLSTVPRVLAILISNRMKWVEFIPRSKKEIMRQILIVSANSGVMVDLFDKLDNDSFRLAEHALSSADFERIQLNWEISSKLKFDAKLFLLPKEGFKNLLASSNEATFGEMFWTGALNAAFLSGMKSGDLRLMQQWDTDKLLPEFPKRRVDYVAALNLLPTDAPNAENNLYPLFFGEYGKRDICRSGCIASAFCLRLAYKLIAMGRKPELARCYGLLTDGTVARLMIAHPVVREVKGEFEIQINVSYPTDWKIDLIDGIGVKREIVKSSPLESFLPADPACPDWNEHDHLGDDEDNYGDPFHIKTPKKQKSGTNNDSSINFEAGVSNSGLSQISYISQLVLQRAALICADNEDTRDTLGKKFNAAPNYGFIPFSHPNTSKHRSVRTANTANHKQPFGKVASKKPVHAVELSVYKNASIFLPGFLPRIYDIIEMPETGEVKYIMESLEHLASNSGVMHSFFAKKRSTEILYINCKFMLDCLFQLYLVHEHLQLVHSDVSPSNIMYSKVDKIWKLNDYNQAMPRSESESTKRVAGTPDFIAPEAVESGLFTTASDVWSLGQIAFNWLLPGLTMGVYCEEDSDSYEEYGQQRRESPEWLQSCCDKVVDCIVKMRSGHPSDRPTVIEAIKLFYSVVARFEIDNCVNDLVLEGVRNLLRSVELSVVVSPITSTNASTIEARSVKRRRNHPAK